MEEGPLKTIRQAIQDLRKYQIEIEGFAIHPWTVDQMLMSKDWHLVVDMGWYEGTNPSRTQKVCGIPFRQKV